METYSTAQSVRRLRTCCKCRGLDFKENMMPLPICYGPKPLERSVYEHVTCYLRDGGDPDTIPLDVLLRVPFAELQKRGYGAKALYRADKGE